MKNIQLFYLGNLRYLVFNIDGQYYLLDRHPAHYFCYLFLPLNWFFYQKVHAITNDDYWKITENYSRASKFTIPASLVGGASVLFTTWMRVNKIYAFQYFDTDFSMAIKTILLVIGLALAYFLLQILYSARRKSIQKVLGKELDQPLYYKMRPEKPLRYFLSIFWAWLFLVAMSIIFAVAFLYLGNIATLLATILMIFFYLGAANGAFSANIKWKYEIVDQLVN